MTTKRQYPTKVARYVWNDKTYRFDLLAEYDDAEVSDREGTRAFGPGAKGAYLRVYLPSIEDYDEIHREGAGLYVKDGVIYDCDGDIAVDRIWMDGVIGFYNYGGGWIEYTGIVSFKEITAWGSGTREVNLWEGSGNYSKIRLEQWVVEFA